MTTWLARGGVAVLVTALTLGCSSGTATGVSDENSPIGVEISQLFITVQNRAGLSLFEVRVEVIPVGAATIFTAFHGRLDSSEKRDFPLGAFNGRDGTPLNLRVTRPKAVRVTARDMNGKNYEVEVGWP